MGLKTPDKILIFQRTLFLKAKEEPGFRFYLLYDKIYCIPPSRIKIVSSSKR